MSESAQEPELIYDRPYLFNRPYEITDVQIETEMWIYKPTPKQPEERKVERLTYRDQHGRFIKKDLLPAVYERKARMERFALAEAGVRIEQPTLFDEAEASPIVSEDAELNVAEELAEDQLIIEEIDLSGLFPGSMLHDTSGHGAFWHSIKGKIQDRWSHRTAEPVAHLEPIKPEQPADLTLLAKLWVSGDATAEQRIDEVLAELGVTDIEDTKAGLKLLATDTDDSWKNFDIEGAGRQEPLQPEVSADIKPDIEPAIPDKISDTVHDPALERLKTLAEEWKAAHLSGGAQLSTPVLWRFENELTACGVHDSRVRSTFMHTMLRLPDDSSQVGEANPEPAEVVDVDHSIAEDVIEQTPETWRSTSELSEQDILRGSIQDAVLYQSKEQFDNAAPVLWELVRDECLKTGDKQPLDALRVWLNDAYYSLEAGRARPALDREGDFKQYLKEGGHPDADLVSQRYKLLKRWGVGGYIWAYDNEKAAELLAYDAKWQEFTDYARGQGLLKQTPQPVETAAANGPIPSVTLFDQDAATPKPLVLPESPRGSHDIGFVPVVVGLADLDEAQYIIPAPPSEPEPTFVFREVRHDQHHEPVTPPPRDERIPFWQRWGKWPKRIIAGSALVSAAAIGVIAQDAWEDSHEKPTGSIDLASGTNDVDENSIIVVDSTEAEPGTLSPSTTAAVPENAQPPIPDNTDMTETSEAPATTEAEAITTVPETDAPVTTRVATTVAPLVTAPPTVPGTAAPTTTLPPTTVVPTTEVPVSTAPETTQPPTTTEAPVTTPASTEVPTTTSPPVAEAPTTTVPPEVADVLDQPPSTEAPATEAPPATPAPTTPAPVETVPETPVVTPPAVPVTYTFTVELPWQQGNQTAWSWAQSLGVPSDKIPAFLTEVMGQDWAAQGQSMQVGDSITVSADVLAKYLGLPTTS